MCHHIRSYPIHSLWKYFCTRYVCVCVSELIYCSNVCVIFFFGFGLYMYNTTVASEVFRPLLIVLFIL